MQIMIVAGLAAAALLVLFATRVGDGYGKIRPSRDSSADYENFRVNPNRHYYISGSDVYPSAIMGIDKDWTLESDLWKFRDLDSLGLKELVQNMQSKGMESSSMLHGFTIHDQRGRIIGDWFSLPGLQVVVKTTGEHRVRIDTPPLDPYSHS